MTTDLVRAIAFAFRRKGADRVPGADLRFVLAFDLRWLAPEDAKRAVRRAVEAGLVREEGDTLVATFDVQGVDVPLNFRPAEGFLDEPVPTELPQKPRDPPAPPANAAAAASAARPEPSPREAPTPPAADEEAARQERARRGNLLSLDAARLVVARRAGDDVRERASELARQILHG